MEWGVKFSTTNNSIHDWCGVRADNLSGVVDLEVEDLDIGALAVGERRRVPVN